eukprot:SAG11_NODE_4821_length_1754_cov_1.427795_1_plen_64_part_10
MAGRTVEEERICRRRRHRDRFLVVHLARVRAVLAAAGVAPSVRSTTSANPTTLPQPPIFTVCVK